MVTSKAAVQLVITFDEDGAFLNTFTDFKLVTLFKKKHFLFIVIFWENKE